MEESKKVEDLQFEWGQKRGIGGKKKDVQFYESFSYDGEEYSLYDCVLVCNDSQPEPFVGKIIKLWEHTDKLKPVKYQKGVKLLWFFKPYEISPYLEGVPSILANELFLASGEGVGLANVNPLEAIGGKCSVVCISKDRRNPQPSDDDIKNANFVFRRTFDVGRCKVLDKIDEKIAGIDVKFILNRTSCKEKARAVQKVDADSNGHPVHVKSDGPSTSGLVKQNGLGSCEASGSRKDDYGGNKGNEIEVHKQLARQQSMHAEEGSTKDSGGRDERGLSNHEASKRSGFREIGYGRKDGKENEGQKHLARQKSVPAEERFTKDSGGLDDRPDNEHESNEASGSKESGFGGKRAKETEGQKQLVRQKSILAKERYSRDSGGTDDRPSKKQKLDGSVTVLDDRNKKMLQKIIPKEENDAKPITPLESHRDKVTRVEKRFQESSNDEKKKSLQALNVLEGKDLKIVKPAVSPQDRAATEKGLPEKPSFDDKQSKCGKDKMLMDIDYKRNYRIFEVTRRPDAETRKWFRELPWEERMRTAQEQGTLVLLQNLDPSYTSDEVEDIVYSCLNERCAAARMIEQMAASIPRIGEALVVFKTRDAAERVIRRLDEGCLLLSSGRPLVASFAKTTPLGKPPPFAGHIKLKSQIQREKVAQRDAVATSHCSQPNTIEYDMAIEWCLQLARSDIAWEKLFKRQREEREKLRVDFKPKCP